MNSKTAKRLKRETFDLMQYDAATRYREVITTKGFRTVYRARKKNYIAGKLVPHVTS